MKKVLTIFLLFPLFLSAQFSLSVNPWTEIGPGEYQTVYKDSVGHLWGGGNLNNRGGNQAGTPGIPIRVAGAAHDTIFSVVCGSLHGFAAIDNHGRGWVFYGDNNQGQMGAGDFTTRYIGYKILTDSTGATFDSLVAVQSYCTDATTPGVGFIWLKANGKPYITGWPKALRGDGTNLSFPAGACKRPVEIILEGSKRAMKVVCGETALFLCTDSTVQSGGNGGANELGYAATGIQNQSYHTIPGLTGIRDIAGGKLWQYALKTVNGHDSLYGWGSYWYAMGDASPSCCAYAIPTNLQDSIVSYLTHGVLIRKIVTNSLGTYILMNNGDLFYHGNSVMGSAGNGYDYFSNPANNYSWDFAHFERQTHPYHIAPTRKFIDVFGGTTFTYTTFATDSTNLSLAWGRNESSTISDGIEGATANIEAIYHNFHDVPWPKPIFPFTITNTYPSTSPICLSSPSGFPCNEYSIPSNTDPVSNAGTDKITGATSVQLDGTGSTDNVYIGIYEWTLVSTTATTDPIIDLPGSATPIISGLLPGLHTFQLKVTDNGWRTNTDQITIQVPNPNVGDFKFKIRKVKRG